MTMMTYTKLEDHIYTINQYILTSEQLNKLLYNLSVWSVENGPENVIVKFNPSTPEHKEHVVLNLFINEIEPSIEWVYMNGGGSHRSNKKLADEISRLGIRAEKGAFRYLSKVGSKTFWSSKKVEYTVHPDDVEKAKLLGMKVSRK